MKIVTWLLTLLLAGCATSKPATQRPTSASQAPIAEALQASPLAGTWRLVSAVETIVGRGSKEVYEKPYSGLLSYSDDGRMSLMIVHGDRPRLRPPDLIDSARLRLYDTLIAYAGSYAIERSTVKHQIDVSSSEVLTGTSETWHIKWVNDKLVLSTGARPRSADASVYERELRWERVSR